MHKLIKYKREIDRTHSGLGNLFSFSLLGTKANKCVIIIGIAGSGKTVSMEAAANVNKNKFIEMSEFTRSGLKRIEKDLQGFRGTFIVRDLGNIDTSYSLNESIKTAVALSYDHKLSKLNSKTDMEITDFYGSFITSVQPEIMPNIVNQPFWEAVVRDKTLRYYHLKRVIDPNAAPFSIKPTWGYDISQVEYHNVKTPLMKELRRVFLDQHGLARADEHLKDLLRAAAALDDRKYTTLEDVKAVLELTRPMRLEKHLIYKTGVASNKEYLVDHNYMLSEFASYKVVSLEQLANNWFVTVKSVQRILMNVKEMFYVRPKDENNIYMKKITEDILKDSGYL